MIFKSHSTHLAIFQILFSAVLFILTTRHSSIIVKCEQNDLLRNPQACGDDINVNNVENPAFIDRRTICNYESNDVFVYKIDMTQNYHLSNICFKSTFEDSFMINDRNEVLLTKYINQSETDISLYFFERDQGSTGVKPVVRYTKFGNIRFNLTLLDCSQAPVKWQTILVAILASICVVLISSLSLMIILYKHKQTRGNSSSSQDDEFHDDRPKRPNEGEETFINPRRTSLYDYNSTAKTSTSGIEMTEIPEE